MGRGIERRRAYAEMGVAKGSSHGEGHLNDAGGGGGNLGKRYSGKKNCLLDAII